MSPLLPQKSLAASHKKRRVKAKQVIISIKEAFTEFVFMPYNRKSSKSLNRNKWYKQNDEEKRKDKKRV